MVVHYVITNIKHTVQIKLHNSTVTSRPTLYLKICLLFHAALNLQHSSNV